MAIAVVLQLGSYAAQLLAIVAIQRDVCRRDSAHEAAILRIRRTPTSGGGGQLRDVVLGEVIA